VLTRIDHVRIGVTDLLSGIESYRRLGFSVHANGIAANERDYLELAKRQHDGLRTVALAGDPIGREVDQVKVVKGKLKEPDRHPNGVVRLERVYIAVADLAASVRKFQRELALPAPKMERGTVIMADLAVFDIGGAGLTLAQPYAPGVAADALARRGPGPFQVLYRTQSMDTAARWLAQHGVPPPVRGVRNTGEQAMLVPPEHACGVYVGFVGMA
jgi:hypothetical protein